jgi:anti-sigma factor RsiW
MSCENFEERISSHLDGVLDAAEREGVLAHLETCRYCGARLKSLGDLRARLRRLEEPPIPRSLAVELRVLASHEHARRLARATWSARIASWSDAIRLNFENLMRPVALPVAGGVLSALLLFGALVPTLIFRHEIGNESPLSFTDPDGMVVNWRPGEIPRLEAVDAVVSSDENVLELTIDDEGRVADYAVRQGQLTPEMLTFIEFSQFTPAMFFGKPTWGKKLVIFPRHRLNVRG